MAIEFVRLGRECPAVKIPGGERLVLPADTEVYITQALGGSFTVQVRSHGGLFRIVGEDADALGKSPVPPSSRPSEAGADIETLVETALRECYDPEIPVNIVDLGLVYDTRVTPLEDSSYRIEVKMTLTAPGCGMGAAIAADAEDKLLALDSVREASVELVWDPPWNPRMISEAGREKLGIG